MLALIDSKNIPESIYKWCITEGKGTEDARKLAALYVAVHLGESYTDWEKTAKVHGDPEFSALAKAFIADVRHHHNKTNGKHALILASLYLSDSPEFH